MTNFEKITETPEALATFLNSLNVPTAPWDEEFHRMFCDSCKRRDCDAERCPNQDKRNNPLWWLGLEEKGGQDTRRNTWVWRNGKLEQAHVVIRDGGRLAVGDCIEFNAYLNGKGPDGKMLKRIKRVILPKVRTNKNGRADPAYMTLVIGRYEDAAEIINLLGKRCKLEIRAVFEDWGKTGKAEFHSIIHVLDAIPLEFKPVPLERLASMDIRIRFRVCRYTATIGDTKLWDFKWTERDSARRRGRDA